MLLNIVADVAKLSLFVACAYLLIVGCARHSRPQLTEHLMQRRSTRVRGTFL